MPINKMGRILVISFNLMLALNLLHFLLVDQMDIADLFL